MCGGKVAIPPIVKEKRRNSEKRKEKSRDAARCRRSKESEIFNNMGKQLPIQPNVVSGLDKASIMRLSIQFFKVKEMLEILIPSEKKLTKCPKDPLYATVLNGFLLVLSHTGDIVYVSENVEELLGTTHVDMMGYSFLDFLHPCDQEDIKALFASKSAYNVENGSVKNETISLFIRMKSALKSKGRTMHLKTAAYQVFHYMGHKFDRPRKDKNVPAFYLMFIGRPIPHPAQIDILLDKEIFISRHSPDMRFTHVDDRIYEFLGYKSSELLGKSVYAYHHALDASALLSSYKTLFTLGQCETGYYRFLSKYGGYIWVVTQATLIYENGKEKPECIVCLNYVLSKTENNNEIVSSQQELKIAKEPVEAQFSYPLKEDRALATPGISLSNTTSIFAPKETVMSKDFLEFPDTDILLFQEPLKDSKLQLDLDLFPDDPCSIEICDDPFISYRDDSLSSPSYCGTPESSFNLSSNSTSPDRYNTTPNTPDSGNLSDIPSLDPLDLDLKFTMPPSASDKDSDFYEEDLDFRAPFISMNMDDDFPLISPSNSVMWGPQEPAPKKSPPPPAPERTINCEPQRNIQRQKPFVENSSKSSLAALLQSDIKKAPLLNKHQEKSGGMGRKEPQLQRRWQTPATENNKNANMRHKNFTPSRSYNGNSGHIIMLDTIPIKRQPAKATGTHRRNGQTATSDRQSNPPPFGSHTATVKVNDRLIKVQVSVSELPTSPIEHKQPFPSPPDPPPKRSSPSRLGPTESPKRLKVDNGFTCSGPQSIARDSVLLNLLISGEDASRGYLCSGNSRYSEIKPEPSVLSIPSHDSNKLCNDLSSNCTELLASESELLDSFLKISQYDAEVNAPIQSSHLLQGDDLLSALDHQPLLRNVPTLV